MYNTVGETAGVTQDVGSDPTVGEFYPEEVYSELYCTFCGGGLDGSCDEEDEEMEVEVEGEGEGDEKKGGVREGWIDLGETSRMEGKEDEELDEEPESCTMNDRRKNAVEAALVDENPENKIS